MPCMSRAVHGIGSTKTKYKNLYMEILDIPWEANHMCRRHIPLTLDSEG